MAEDQPIDTPAKPARTRRERTTQAILFAPLGGDLSVESYREVVLLDEDGALVRRVPEESRSDRASIVGRMFARPDGSTFTGEQLAADVDLACDQIVAEARAEEARKKEESEKAAREAEEERARLEDMAARARADADEAAREDAARAMDRVTAVRDKQKKRPR